MTKREMTTASFCAMACNEGGFHKFLEQRFDQRCPDAKAAKQIVTYHCGIDSRTELNTKGPEQEKWQALQAEYRDWLRR